MKADTLLSVTRAAELLGVSADTIARAIESGELKTVGYSAKGAKDRHLVSVGALRELRTTLVNRYSDMPSDYHREMMARLKGAKL